MRKLYNSMPNKHQRVRNICSHVQRKISYGSDSLRYLFFIKFMQSYGFDLLTYTVYTLTGNHVVFSKLCVNL